MGELYHIVDVIESEVNELGEWMYRELDLRTCLYE